MPSAASIAVIVNARAGTAAGQAPIGTELADLFRAAGRDAEIITLHNRESTIDAARTASAHASIVVAAGGDGTVSSVVAGVLESPAALGVLPLGTLNHFAKDLGIPLDLREAIAVVAAGHIRQVDVGRLNEHVFVNNSSIGIYPSIVGAREDLRRRGHRKWPAMVMATLRVLRRHRGVTVSIDVDGERRTWRTPFVFVGNNEYSIDGIGLGARARLDEGRLFVYLAPRVRARHLPMLFVKSLLGRGRLPGGFEIMPATELWIDVSRNRRHRVAFDGEVTTMNSPLHFRACPKALPVVLPQT
jgi:diacylglycerol kinase family enzyme